MEICHDSKKTSTLWTHFRLTPRIQHSQKNVRREFLKGAFYPNTNPDVYYNRTIQRQTIEKTLGSKEIANKIMPIDDESTLYLSRGHLAAKSDFVFAPQQNATFIYINAAPQWQSFNGGNWKEIEEGVKKFVKDKNVNVEVYTGTYGIFKYPDVTGKEQEIFLDGNRKQIPVPRFYYKVLIAEKLEAGIVFIGVNNPFVSLADITKSGYILCPDVADDVKYINW